eukprot:TRINITY_DN1628_c0_g1_i9.p1 TRINITY_DN1628_c0_g1~~TRINITY_DN1628_c0_g1_i9.p1  ORF type:complete len:158 (-),score=42.75 TRINITY_DN1628_c0_g1_i9:107-580(-)
MQLWDTAGQERFKNLIPNYLRDCQVAVIVYDITNRESFEATSYWVKEVNEITNKNVVIALVGNKLDLESERAVQKEEGEKLARENNMSFVEVSASTGENLAEIFNEIGKRVLEEMPADEKQKPNDLIHLEQPLSFTAESGQKTNGAQAVSRRRGCCA